MLSLITIKANNWVERGESADRKLRLVLAFFFDRHDESHGPWLQAHAVSIIGLVEAGAVERDIAKYLNSVLREEDFPYREHSGARIAAVSLWHIAKIAQMRDLAERVFRGERPISAQTGSDFGTWAAERLLDRHEVELREIELADESGSIDDSRGLK